MTQCERTFKKFAKILALLSNAECQASSPQYYTQSSGKQLALSAHIQITSPLDKYTLAVKWWDVTASLLQP